MADVVVENLDQAHFEQLTDEQLRMVERVMMKRDHEKVVNRWKEVLKGKETEIFKALSEAPFTYVSPPIAVIPGRTIRLTTMHTLQVKEAQESMEGEVKRGESLLLSSIRFNTGLLAVALHEVDGQPCAGVTLDPEFHEMDKVKAIEHAKALRVARLNYIDKQNSIVIDRMVTFGQVFQNLVEHLIKHEEWGTVLGN